MGCSGPGAVGVIFSGGGTETSRVPRVRGSELEDPAPASVSVRLAYPLLIMASSLGYSML